jgi:hypothetical protein
MKAMSSPRLPRIDFALDLAVRIEGIDLPFRLKCATSDHAKLMNQLDGFWKMVKTRIHEAAKED